MARKTVKFTESGIGNLPNNKPAVYEILTPGGKTNYVGSAKKGRISERLQEHLDAGKIPGAKVRIEQQPSIENAQKKEQGMISRSAPKPV